jgi:flagellar M-ring protein FliF
MFESLFGRGAASRQIAIIGVGVLVTALVFGVSRWATKPAMMPLYADVPIASVGTITDKLTESAITFELDHNGTTILVPAADIVRARVALAREAMPESGRPGMELFDKPTWGMTDFTQKVNYGRALEGELERTIGKMRDVEAVQVHLVLEDEALYKQNERPSKASVTLTMKGGEAPPVPTVRGIASLVASSVGGLEPQHVTIVDERGHALTADDDGSVAGLTGRQLTMQRDVESYLEKKAETLVASLVGTGNARVQVSASINFDKVERTTQSVDPDKQATTTEQRAEVTPGTPQQGAGYSTVATSFENTRSTESFTGAIGNLRKITVAVLVADKMTVAAPDSASKTSAPPVVTQRSAEELARIETLVRNALGVDSTRGDLISVVSAPFDLPVAIRKRDTLPTPDMMTRVQANPKPLVATGALIVLLVMAVVLIGALKPKKGSAKSQQQQQLRAASSYPELPPSPNMASALQPATQQEHYIEERRPVILPPLATTPEREQAIATVDQRPEAAVRVVRNWLRA